MVAPSVLTLVEGNTLKLKLEGIHKSNVLQAHVDQPNILTVKDAKHNARSDSWQFEFLAKQAGLARVNIVAAKGSSLSVSPSAIIVKIETAMTLPAMDTEVGMLVRLLLAESRSFGRVDSSGMVADIKKGMQWMRRVIINRLCSDKPEEFMARGAKAVGDIIRAHDRGSVQFHGFNNYPNLDAGITRNINALLAIANNGTHPKQAAYVEFLQNAIDVASEPLPQDPSPNGLFAWKTENAVSPGPAFIPYAVLAGNQFYTHSRLKKKD
ncbi:MULTISPECIES: hypothetical protein [unclassified Acidovorax]|uniref:hypothetical protein n=1 Tax=unclassified Acidovorax TaxID=2684926 RepID=UPI001F359BD0|nr:MULTISPECIES: hypothetical protein [unclassified Acidovorax]